MIIRRSNATVNHLAYSLLASALMMMMMIIIITIIIKGKNVKRFTYDIP